MNKKMPTSNSQMQALKSIKYNAKDTQSQRVYEYICQASKEKPVYKSYLMAVSGKDERSVRSIIEDMRDQGIRVVGDSNKAGYYIAEDESQYQQFRRIYMAKALTIFRRINAMDNHVDNQIDIIEYYMNLQGKEK